MKESLFTIIAVSVFVFVGCQPRKNLTNSTIENAPLQNVSKSDSGKSTIDFETAPSQIKAGETAFVVETAANREEKAVDLKNAVIPEGAFKIVVSENGFTPQEISFQQNQPLKLAFYRADANNCGSEVVFLNLNIRKKLPVGKVVLIDVPTAKTGEISFACGMDMMKGKIVIQ